MNIRGVLPIITYTGGATIRARRKTTTCSEGGDEISKVHGDTSSLKPRELQLLQRIYRRRIPPSAVVTPELARHLSQLTHTVEKPLSILVDRRGRVRVVYLGEPHALPFDDLLDRRREAKFRLRGVRLLKTAPRSRGLTRNDLTTLVNERLDLITWIETGEDGRPGRIEMAHVLPPRREGPPWNIERWHDSGRIDISADELIASLEEEIERAWRAGGGLDEKEGVFLIGFSTETRERAEESARELRELALSADKIVLETEIQIRRHPDPRYLIGKGKLEQIILKAKQVGADTLIFDVELTPAQVRAISEQTNLNVMDRTQLILEIFASRAVSSEGKMQVQLAQLRYTLPRLTGKGKELSQLGGGIGTRGPGEKKLEEQRRMLRKRIGVLEKQIDKLAERRERGRKQRRENLIPTVTLIGYTSAGKSTLFNTLTRSSVTTSPKLFSTLNPTTRKMRLPGGGIILLTDTVGFIRDLPEEVRKAFRATLEELGESTLLLHVADVSDPRLDSAIESVETILAESGLDQVPRLLVLNKADRLPPEERDRMGKLYKAPLVCALDRSTLEDLLLKMDELINNTYRPGEPQEKGVDVPADRAKTGTL